LWLGRLAVSTLDTRYFCSQLYICITRGPGSSSEKSDSRLEDVVLELILTFIIICKRLYYSGIFEAKAVIKRHDVKLALMQTPYPAYVRLFVEHTSLVACHTDHVLAKALHHLLSMPAVRHGPNRLPLHTARGATMRSVMSMVSMVPNWALRVSRHGATRAISSVEGSASPAAALV
jgi:hypothetical protein